MPVSSLRRMAVPGAVATTTVVLGLPALALPANTLDELILLDYPLRMLDGDLPYRDFFAAYGPAHWWFLEGVVGLLGPSLLALRVVGLGLHVVLTLGLARLARPAGPAASVTAGVLAALMLFRLGDAPYAWISVAALTVWQLALLRDGATRRTLLWAGVLAGLALAVRPDALPVVLLPALPFIARRRTASAWLLGCALGALPLALGFVLTPGPFLDDIVLGRAGKGAGQSRLPFVPANQAVLGLYLILVVALLLLALHATLLRNRWALALLLLAVGATPQALQRLDLAHLTYAGVLYLPLLPVVVQALLARYRHTGRAGLVMGVALALLGMAGSALYPLLQDLVGRGPRAVTVTHQGRSLPLTESSAPTTRALLRLVDAHSSPGETLFVFDANLVRPAVNDVSLYYLLPRLRQRALYVEVTPGVSSEQGSGLKDDVEAADVLVLIDATEGFRRALFPYQRDGSTEAQDVVRREFCQVGRADYYVVLRRC